MFAWTLTAQAHNLNEAPGDEYYPFSLREDKSKKLDEGVILTTHTF